MAGLTDGGGTGGNGGGDGTGGGDGGGGGTGGGTTGATNPPPGGKFPIEHIIVVVKENHTFDNYFGTFPGAEGTTDGADLDGAGHRRPPAGADSRAISATSTACALADWNHGGMDHWDLGDTKNASDQLAFAQYLEDDIPNYWQYARHFTLADHFFSAMLGPVVPRAHVRARGADRLGDGKSELEQHHAARHLGLRRSAGLDARGARSTAAAPRKQVSPCYEFPTVVDGLPPAVTWKFYGSTLPPVIGEVWSMFDGVEHIRMSDAWKNNVVDASSSTATSTPATCRRSCFSSTRTWRASTRRSTSARARTGPSAT